MSVSYTEHFSTKTTPQSEPIPGKPMVKNSAGGFTFKLDKFGQLDRFLILGSEGGTYYTTEKSLTVENAKNTIECIKADGLEVVRRLVAVSTKGRAPKNDSAIFVLALCTAFGDANTKKAAYDAIHQVCRIGTHLFQFCENVQALRGWSRGLRNGVGKFYDEKSVEGLAMQLVKYQSRNGWSHRDVLRLAHPKYAGDKNVLLRWAVGKDLPESLYPQGHHPLIGAFEDMKALDVKAKGSVKTAVKLITQYGLPRECVPTELLNSVEVWEALLQEMPVMAMVRNLGKMTSVGLLKGNLDASVKKVRSVLGNADAIKKSRVHPMALLLAAKIYAQGRGMKGSLSWSPVAGILDSLDSAFYTAFANVAPTNQNYLLALDVSGSMGSNVNNYPISAREASAALALVTAKTEANHEIVGFTGNTGHGSFAFSSQQTALKKLAISPRQRLDDAVRVISGLPFGPTDCALPMQYALEQKKHVDAFVIYTDNETWHGKEHPKQALDKYRQKMGVAAKCIVVGLTGSAFTIADPSDSGMMDVVGLDPSIPEVMAQFVGGLVL